ncbi:MAG TPA: TIGR03086 family metal-binding protein [Acidimicrobiia bacterium]
MDVDLAELHARALQSARRPVAAVQANQWGQPSNCGDWTVRELVNHMVAGNSWAAELAAGKTVEEVGTRLDGDVLGNDPLQAYDDSAAAAVAAFGAPGAMDAPCAVSYGPVPGSEYCGHRLMDVLIHGWDVARSTGQDATLEPELVEICWALIEPHRDLLAGSGMFGSEVTVADDADGQTRLLAALGRGV